MRLDRMISRLHRFSWPERMLALEAFGTLACVRLILAMLPFAVAMRQFRLHPSSSQPEIHKDAAYPAGTVPDAVRDAVRRAGKIAPFRAVCLQQAIAASLMLRRRGLPAQVYFGVARDGKTALEAHAWSICDGVVVTGERGRTRYVQVAVFVS